MNKKSPNDSIFKTKKFYVALYSCLGVLLVLAAVISFMNLNTAQKNANNATSEMEAQQSQIAPVVKNEAESYLTPEDRSASRQQAETENDGISALKPLTETPNTTEKPATGTATKAPTAEPSSSKPDTSKLQPKTAPPATEEPKKTTSEDERQTETGLAEPIFSSYSEDTEMLWPVTGEIVMDFSADRLIYDKTLEQYRTNNSISIAAAAGAQVKAAADGVVKSVVFQNTEDGNKIVIDNGNGWLTTYGQLQDQVLVKEGDVVKAGQVIGGVNNPTRSGILLGSHLKLAITKDEIAVDPKSLMAAN